jgi:undecaprenyl-diphosphatase
LKYAALLLAAMAGITLLVETVKTLIQSQRPINGIVVETGYSFPSGHVTGTMVFLGLLTYFAWQRWKNPRTKTLITPLYIATESLVGFSRVYLNVHWLSDILGGYLLGLFWLTFTIFLYQYSENKWPNKTQN